MNAKDLTIVGAFLLGAVGVAAFAIAGMLEWAVAGIGGMFALYVVLARLNAVANRTRSRKLAANLRAASKKLDAVRDKQNVTLRKLKMIADDSADLRRDAKALRKAASGQGRSVAAITQEVQRLRPELRGIRVSQQLLSQSVDEAKTLLTDADSAQQSVAGEASRN
ncbi:hypothetical protein [Nesterenkonia ebinurensis]|uniref:hypothetical protein n=1 Tax=Nesterenkonia ebinurensis TaxID=2608252 RepID=UPI00123D84B4|nr:hypothetical protein [Nesterenkonia ebinurensis]